MKKLFLSLTFLLCLSALFCDTPVNFITYKEVPGRNVFVIATFDTPKEKETAKDFPYSMTITLSDGPGENYSQQVAVLFFYKDKNTMLLDYQKALKTYKYQPDFDSFEATYEAEYEKGNFEKFVTANNNILLVIYHTKRD